MPVAAKTGLLFKKTVAEAKRIFPPPKKVQFPELPDPVATPQQVTQQAQQAGTAERRRLRGRGGRAKTIFAGRRALPSATVARAGLKTTFG